MLSAQLGQPVTDLADTFFQFRINTLAATAYALLVLVSMPLRRSEEKERRLEE